jgi:mono/diheme cytochrome c family protein
MTKFVRLLFALAAVAITFAAGCGSARRDEPITHPLVPQNQTIALGQRVFAANCDQCHPGGSGGEGPALNNRFLPGAFISLQVRSGLGAMPPFDQTQISDKELDAVIAYLQSLHDLGGAK